jgi:hypothetical protein
MLCLYPHLPRSWARMVDVMVRMRRNVGGFIFIIN